MAFNPSSNNLSGAGDIAFSNPSSSQILSYDASVQKWKNTSRPEIVPVLSSAASRPIVPAGSIVMIIGGTVRPAWSVAGDLWAREG